MVKIRLSRGGTKKRPFFHVVATNSRSSRDGKYIERLGFFNPSALDHEEDIRIDLERVKYWESQGAILSDRVRSLIKLLAVDREQRRAQRAEKINKKKIARKEKKLQETPVEDLVFSSARRWSRSAKARSVSPSIWSKVTHSRPPSGHAMSQACSFPSASNWLT